MDSPIAISFMSMLLIISTSNAQEGPWSTVKEHATETTIATASEKQYTRTITNNAVPTKPSLPVPTKLHDTNATSEPIEKVPAELLNATIIIMAPTKKTTTPITSSVATQSTTTTTPITGSLIKRRCLSYVTVVNNT